MRRNSEQDNDAATHSRRFESLVSSGDLIQWQALRDLEAFPSRNERIVDRSRGLHFVSRPEVVATQEVDPDVLEKKRPERNGRGGGVRGVGRYGSMHRQQFEIDGDVGPEGDLDDVVNAPWRNRSNTLD